MSDLFSNPRALLALLCLGSLVIGFNLILVGHLRGNKAVQEEAAKWGKALRGGQQAHRRQQDQLDELHRLVSGLEAAPPDRLAPEGDQSGPDRGLPGGQMENK